MIEASDLLRAYDLAARHSSDTIEGYLNYLVIDSDPPGRLKPRLARWQAEVYSLLSPLVEAACGLHPDYDGPRSAFVVAPRGHSKTSSTAQLLNWSLCYARHFVSITACAADKDQARILVERMRREASHNPHLANNLTFRTYHAFGPTGEIEVISSDIGSASGKLSDLYLLDELCWWSDERGRELYEVLMTGKAKRKQAATIIITNAGVLNTWQYHQWLHAQDSDRWIAHEVKPFSAQWMHRNEIEDQRKMLLPSVFRRAHENVWVDPTADCEYVTRQQLEACIDPHRSYTTRNKRFKHIAAIDLGLVNDRTVCAVVHMEKDTLVLDKMDVWQGTPESPVKLEAVEDWLIKTVQNFNLVHLVLDPYQLQHLAQKYERKLNVERFSFSGQSHFRMAENLRHLIINERLSIYPHAGALDNTDLVEEILKLVIEERAGGQLYRLNHQDGEHDDRYCALALAALAAVRLHHLASPVSTMRQWLPDIEEQEAIMFHQIKHYANYNTYQLCPMINGQEVKLHDYQSQTEAAWAINYIARLWNQKEPNTLSAEQLPSPARQQNIKGEVNRALEDRKLCPPPKVEPKKKEAK